jgi:hypothetical protein
MTLFLGFHRKNSFNPGLIESDRFHFAKLTCCGFEHESLHAIENDNEAVMRTLWSLANQVLQQQLQHGHTYKL